MVAADFGCGSGGWVLPLAKKLDDGRIIAIDILEEPLSALKSKAKSQGFSNVETVLSDVEKGVRLQDEECDLVLLTNFLFEVEDKKAVFDEVKRVLKPKGKVLIVDWKKEAAMGPEQGRISADEVKKIAKGRGLKLEKEFDAGAYHYGLVFEK